MNKLNLELINNVLEKEKSILAGYIFGSEAADKSNKYSDIDLAILFDNTIKENDYTDKQIEIMNSLTEKLNREVDIVILNRAPLLLRYQVLKNGIRIYERLNRNEHNFEAQSIIQYFDFLPIRNRIEKALLSKIKEA